MLGAGATVEATEGAGGGASDGRGAHRAVRFSAERLMREEGGWVTGPGDADVNRARIAPPSWSRIEPGAGTGAAVCRLLQPLARQET